MDRKIINKRIGVIRGDVERLMRILSAIEHTDPAKYPEEYESLSTDAALIGEIVTCRLRHLIYVATGVKKSDYLMSAGVVQKIQVKCEGNVLEISLPCLLPKRRQRRSAEFLVDPLYFTLRNYLQKNSLPSFEHCVVCFIHIYDKNLSIGRIRDYDNLELKQILDVVNAFVMTDDTGLLCDTYNTTELGERDFTCILVMEKEDFAKWLEGRKNGSRCISGY